MKKCFPAKGGGGAVEITNMDGAQEKAKHAA